MCKPKTNTNAIENITDLIILDMNFNDDDSDSSEDQDDANDIDLMDDPNIIYNDNHSDMSDSDDDVWESDPNDYSDEEFMMNNENNSNVNIQFLKNGLIFINHIEQDRTSADFDQQNGGSINNDNNTSFFVYEPLPDIDYIKIDCELTIEDIVDHIEAIFDNTNKHLCRYCL